MGKITKSIVGGLWLAVFGCAQGQGFPSGPMRIIAGVAPGVPSDLLSRGLIDPLSKQFGVPLVVENRIGADSIIGTLACAKAPADGQTLCSTGNSAISLNAAMRANLPYDPVKDLAGVVLIGFFDSCLAANANVPASNVKELIAYARAKPGSVNWGHFGVNSTGYLYEEYLNKSQNAGFYQVPYKTQPQVLQALISGEAQTGVYAWPNLMPFLSTGKVKCLAMTSFQRLPNFPNVPTFAEEGIKLPLRGWFSFHYQAAVPRPVVQRVNAEIRKTLQTAEYRTLLGKLGMQQADGTPEEFDQFVRDQVRDTAELIKYLGIKPLTE